MNKTKEAFIQSINAAIETLKGKGIAPTQKAVSIETGLSIATIKRHGKDRVSDIKPDRVSVSSNRESTLINRVSDNKPASLDRASLSGFERFKRRANKSTMGTSYVNPSEF